MSKGSWSRVSDSEAYGRTLDRIKREEARKRKEQDRQQQKGHNDEDIED